MKNTIVNASFLLFLLMYGGACLAQTPTSPGLSPVENIGRVADKLIRNTPFAYRLRLREPQKAFENIAFLNFAHNFPASEPAVAYAISTLHSPEETTLSMQLSHSDGLKIWLNGQPVYEKQRTGPVEVAYKERAIELAFGFEAQLKKGSNTLLVKSETDGSGDWSFYLRPTTPLQGLELRVDGLLLVHSSMAEVTNWLVAGPFPNPSEAEGGREGLTNAYEPEKGFETARLYRHNGRDIAWQIARPEIKAEGFGSTMAWGDNNFSWNYHAGGTAWAMGHLGHYLNEPRYMDYSRRYGDFFIEKRPYLGWQKYQAGGMHEGDNRIQESQMLDFTAAPGLLYVYWLQQNLDFENRDEWETFFREILDYTVNRQVRLPTGNFTRDTPKRYTTWADDMFMGIPFLLHAARYSINPEQKRELFDDAASQLFAFNEQVFDQERQLYRQAQFSEEKVKIPFWSRGNGWALWATTELLTLLPEKHPQRKRILAHYRNHINALLPLQNPENGFWHNLLDHPDSFEETSGTAIFVMAMARGINQGWLKEKRYLPAVLKGWMAIESAIEEDGTLHGTCVGTNMSEDVQHYYTRPVADDDTHGIFPVIFAGLEVAELLKKTR